MRGSDIVALANEKLEQEYVFGARVPLDDADWPGPWDCAEYCSWGVFQASQIVYGCLDNAEDPSIADAWTGSWKRDSVRRGDIISVAEAAWTPGAMLLRRNRVSGHIAISAGTGNTTLEAKGEQYGVVEDFVKGRRWNHGVLIPEISYEVNPSASTKTQSFDLLTPRVFFLGDVRMRSRRVLMAKHKLTQLGFYEGNLDEEFDELFAVAVLAFQIQKGLTPDGELGSSTAFAMGLDWSEAGN